MDLGPVLDHKRVSLVLAYSSSACTVAPPHAIGNIFATRPGRPRISSGALLIAATPRLDASYLRWNSQWGTELAFGRLPEITDQQTLHGLEYQWFAVLHSHVLVALRKQ